MKFLSALKKFGAEALKIGQYVAFGISAVQEVQQRIAPGRNIGFLERLQEIIKGVEVTGQAAGTVLGSMVLSGPQKLAAGTALVAQELAALNVGGKAIKDVDAFARAAKGYAQATVDYLQAFDEGAVEVVKHGDTVSLAPAPAGA